MYAVTGDNFPGVSYSDVFSSSIIYCLWKNWIKTASYCHCALPEDYMCVSTLNEWGKCRDLVSFIAGQVESIVSFTMHTIRNLAHRSFKTHECIYSIWFWGAIYWMIKWNAQNALSFDSVDCLRTISQSSWSGWAPGLYRLRIFKQVAQNGIWERGIWAVRRSVSDVRLRRKRANAVDIWYFFETNKTVFLFYTSQNIFRSIKKMPKIIL